MKKLLWLELIIATLLLASCSLARPEAQEPPQRDRLIGLYVTDRYVDSCNDAMAELTAGSMEDLAAQLSALQAQPVEGWLDVEGDQLSFGDIEGYPFIYARFTQTSPENGRPVEVMTGVRAENLFDLKIQNSDTGEHISASLAFDASRVSVSNHLIFYSNTVYMRHDGSVYMLPGSGMQVDHPSRCSFSVSEKQSLTVNDQTTEKEISYELVMEPQQPALSLVLSQTAKNGEVLQRDEFAPDQLPPSYERLPDTAYILVELSQAGGVKRWDIISNEENYYHVFSPGQGLILKQSAISLEPAER